MSIIVIHPNFSDLGDFVERLPEVFDSEGERIYKGRNEVKVFSVGGRRLVVKSFKKPHPVNRIAYTFFRASKARRSYYYSLELIARGFNAPAPAAFIEMFEAGLLKRSYYVSDFAEGVTLRNEFCFIYDMTAEKRSVLLAFAAFTVRLHEAGVYHRDYSNGNIIYREDGQGGWRFEMVDVNRLRFFRVDWAMGCKSFHRLDFSIEMLETVAGEYARQRGWDVGKTIARTVACNLRTMKPYKSFNL